VRYILFLLGILTVSCGAKDQLDPRNQFIGKYEGIAVEETFELGALKYDTIPQQVTLVAVGSGNEITLASNQSYYNFKLESTTFISTESTDVGPVPTLVAGNNKLVLVDIDTPNAPNLYIYASR
jgi:hypothetical protein